VVSPSALQVVMVVQVAASAQEMLPSSRTGRNAACGAN